VLHVERVASDQIVHFGEPWPFELPSAATKLQNLGDEIMDPPQVEDHRWKHAEDEVIFQKGVCAMFSAMEQV